MVRLIETNIGMGLNFQRTPFEVIQSAGAFFLTKNPEFFRKNAEIQSYCRYIEAQDPDIVYLTEVCWEDQKNDICNFLESKGYRVTYMSAFELHNMDAESHRFLYNIVAARAVIVTHREFQSSVENKLAEKIYSFSRLYDQLGKRVTISHERYTKLKTKKFVNGILDWAGVHCEIDGIHFWLLHAHATSSSIITNLRDSLPDDKKGILGWDFNVTQKTGMELVGKNFRYIKPDKKTYPFYGQRNSTSSRTIGIIASQSSLLLSHPDQFYKNSLIPTATAHVFWPHETWLWSDHGVTHLKFKE